MNILSLLLIVGSLTSYIDKPFPLPYARIVDHDTALSCVVCAWEYMDDAHHIPAASSHPK